MIQALELILQPRLKIAEMLKQLTIEQLNTVPPGFNNNIVWNIGHMVATQQGICYKRVNQPIAVSDEFFDTFKPGTKPERFFEAAEVEEIFSLFSSTLTLLEADLQTNKFAGYPTWTTRFGFEVKSIEDAVSFISFHEGMHIGAIIALRRFVG